MTIHDKLAARLEATDGDTVDAAYHVRRGCYDDALGVREPTLEDVKREAMRVYGRDAVCDVTGGSLRIYESSSMAHMGVDVMRLPTVAAAYAALRSLPDWKGGEMSIHDKLAARIHAFADTLRAKPFAEEKLAATYVSDVARAFVEGDFDDILGAREPTLDDVKREAVRVFGPGAGVYMYKSGEVDVWKDKQVFDYETLASAYATLRTLPDWKGEE